MQATIGEVIANRVCCFSIIGTFTTVQSSRISGDSQGSLYIFLYCMFFSGFDLGKNQFRHNSL